MTAEREISQTLSLLCSILTSHPLASTHDVYIANGYKNSCSFHPEKMVVDGSVPARVYSVLILSSVRKGEEEVAIYTKHVWMCE